MSWEVDSQINIWMFSLIYSELKKPTWHYRRRKILRLLRFFRNAAIQLLCPSRWNDIIVEYYIWGGPCKGCTLESREDIFRKWLGWYLLAKHFRNIAATRMKEPRLFLGSQDGFLSNWLVFLISSCKVLNRVLRYQSFSNIWCIFTGGTQWCAETHSAGGFDQLTNCSYLRKGHKKYCGQLSCSVADFW